MNVFSINRYFAEMTVVELR